MNESNPLHICYNNVRLSSYVPESTQLAALL